MVRWFAEGMDVILDEKPDPLGLPGFFPCPEPLAANLTTSKFVPRSTFYLAEQLYADAHDLSGRIHHLIAMIKVNMAYDESNHGLAELLKAAEGAVVPVKNWSTFVANGAVQGGVAFLPIQMMSAVLAECVTQLELLKRQIYEITGQSDIMRGMATQKATATEQRIKARFGSSRIQAEQDEFARFATDAQKIRAHIIAKHFDAKTIVQRSNIEAGNDPQIVQQAVELLKQDVAQYRVEVDSDSLSLTDWDAVKQDSVEVITAVSEYVQRWTPIIQTGGPAMAQFALEMLQAFVATLRGSQRYEGIIDRAVQQMKAAAAQPKPPPPPDPRMVAEKAKAEATMVKAKVDTQSTMLDAQVKQAEHGMRMREIQAEVVKDTVETRNAMQRAAVQPPEFGAPV
jgi:hypothetical protein